MHTCAHTHMHVLELTHSQMLCDIFCRRVLTSQRLQYLVLQVSGNIISSPKKSKGVKKGAMDAVEIGFPPRIAYWAWDPGPRTCSAAILQWSDIVGPSKQVLYWKSGQRHRHVLADQ